MNELIAVLAAGRASRFGADKLAQRCAGKPLGRWALEAALSQGRAVVWITSGDRPDYVPRTCEVLTNPDAGSGLATSIACAARAAERRERSGLLIVLADMPLVGGKLLARLLTIDGPAACRYPGGHPGVPALFPSSDFARLQRLSGDRGAAALLAGLAPDQLIECDDNRLFDVDRPADLIKAGELLRRADL